MSTDAEQAPMVEQQGDVLAVVSRRGAWACIRVEMCGFHPAGSGGPSRIGGAGC